MKPLMLKMQAFGPYADLATIDFEKLSSGVFLITGPTGSGKTTVFDAISYALFGQTSGKQRDAALMRSDHASSDVETFVELEFEQGGVRYRCHRSPEQTRKKLRGEGTRTIPAAAILENLDDSVLLADKVKQANEAVEELLGMMAEQFGRICMIAQGDFAAVLTADSKERSELFRRLFSTESYQQIQLLLKNRFEDVSRQLSSLEEKKLDALGSLVIAHDSPLREQLDSLAAVQGSPTFASCLQLCEAVLAQDKLQSKHLEETRVDLRTQLDDANTRLGQLKELEKIQQRLESAKAWLQAHAGDVSNAQEALFQEEAQTQKRESLAARIALLQAALPKYAQLTALCAHEEKQQVQLQALNDKLVQAQRQKDTFEQRVLQQQEQLTQYSELAVQEVSLESAQQNLSRSLDALRSLDEANRKLNASRSTVQIKREKASSANITYAAANESFLQAQLLYNRSIAGVLAQHLQDNAPCPVCGSTEHPAPALLESGTVSKGELDKLEAAMESARQAASAAAQEVAVAGNTLQNCQEDVVKQAKMVFDDDSLGNLDQRISQERSKLEARCRDVEASKRELDKQRKAKLELEGSLSVDREKLQELESGLASFQEQSQDARLQLARITEQRLAARQSLEFDNEQAANEELDRLSRDHESSVKALDAAREELNAAKLQQTQRLDEVKRCEEQLEGRTASDASALEEQARELAVRQSALDDELRRLHLALDVNGKAYDELQRLGSQAAELENAYTLLKPMSRYANGEDSGALGKVKFETFVQGFYFNNVLGAANVRLLEMSEGRYLLSHRATASDKRSVAGLDLDVMDRYTGQKRDVSTLSGGETFLASLALALGFSDAIQQVTGGAAVDAMFVDEGFGSLDEDTCQLAVNVLARLGDDSRMVGIISHVDELKTHIPRQIVVEKTQNGSHLELRV